MKYAQISQGEVKYLFESKLGTSEWAVYLCLAAHCQNKDWCFPPFKKIHTWLGGTKTIKTIETSMTGLVKKGVVLRGYRGERKRWRLTYRVNNNTSVTAIKHNPPKVKGTPQGLGLKVQGTNPPKVKRSNPPKVESIIEKLKEKKKNSISNEAEEVTEEMLIQKLNEDWTFKVDVIINGYAWFTEATGIVLSIGDRNSIKRIWFTKIYPLEHKRNLIEKVIKNKYFK